MGNLPRSYKPQSLQRLFGGTHTKLFLVVQLNDRSMFHIFHTQTFTAWHTEPKFMGSVCLMLGRVGDSPVEKNRYSVYWSSAKLYVLIKTLHAGRAAEGCSQGLIKNGLVYFWKTYATTEWYEVWAKSDDSAYLECGIPHFVNSLQNFKICITTPGFSWEVDWPYTRPNMAEPYEKRYSCSIEEYPPQMPYPLGNISFAIVLQQIQTHQH